MGDRRHTFYRSVKSLLYPISESGIGDYTPLSELRFTTHCGPLMRRAIWISIRRLKYGEVERLLGEAWDADLDEMDRSRSSTGSG